MARKQKSVSDLSRREILKYGLYGGLAAGLAGSLRLGGCGKKRQGERPDIILISIDSLRPDHLGCYGYQRQTSPTIDRLAQEGVRFTKAVSTTSWTLPSYAALFTGLYDSAHGLVDNGLRLAETHVTLAEVLCRAGYQTAGFFGGPYLHSAFGLGRGFTTYQSCMTALSDDASDEVVRRESRREVNVSHADITGPRTLEKFSSWLKMADERPMFVFLHMWDVHYDYIPPRQYVDMFDPDYTGSVNAKNFMRNNAVHANMSERDLQHVVALYDGEIRFTDDILAHILAELDRYGRMEQALILVTADHGEEFFEHGDKGHARTLYDEVIRVPLIFRWPNRLREAVVIEQQVRLIDVMPTILSLAGVPLNVKIQGRDISGLLRGQKISEQSAFCELLLNKGRDRALRTNRKKVWVNGLTKVRMCFDLLSDPGEHRPLVPTGRKFRRALSELAEVTQESLALYERRVGRASRDVELSEDIKKRLRSLGYIGGGDDEKE